MCTSILVIIRLQMYPGFLFAYVNKLVSLTINLNTQSEVSQLKPGY